MFVSTRIATGLGKSLSLQGVMSSVRRSLCASVVHSSAQLGFTADSAALYEKGRPTYSESSLHQICSVLKRVKEESADRSQRVIAELGAGTGKFTTSFVPFLHNRVSSHLSDDLCNAHYVATEPSEGFRKTLTEKELLNVSAVFGTGEKIPLADSEADMIIAAQAFHWMANASTLREAHRVLHKNGALVMIWNTYDYSVDWVRELDVQILSPAYAHKEQVPRQQTGLWRNCFREDYRRGSALSLFSNLHAWYEPYLHMSDREGIVGRIMSTSVVAERDTAYKQEVLAKLNHILDTHPSLADARASDVFAMPYVTELVWTFAKK